jgi:hypothetical protein
MWCIDLQGGVLIRGEVYRLSVHPRRADNRYASLHIVFVGDWERRHSGLRFAIFFLYPDAILATQVHTRD